MMLLSITFYYFLLDITLFLVLHLSQPFRLSRRDSLMSRFFPPFSASAASPQRLKHPSEI